MENEIKDKIFATASKTIRWVKIQKGLGKYMMSPAPLCRGGESGSTAQGMNGTWYRDTADDSKGPPIMNFLI